MFDFGIVGAGNIGGAHKDALLKHEECNIAAICDIALERAKALAEGTDAAVYADYKEMLEKEKLDAVILNLPHYLHKEASIYCLSKGVNVLLEKPMANTLHECDEMIEAMKKSGKVLAIGHLQRYFTTVRKVKEIIENETLGKLSMISMTRNKAYFKNRPEWFLSKEKAGGGILMNYGAHSLDKILYTTGLKAEKVFACGNNFLTGHDIEAGAQLLIKMSEGVSVSISHCGCNVPYEDEAVYYFTNGSVKVVGASQVFISEGDGGYKEIQPENSGISAMYGQLKEFVKMLKGEESEMVTAEYAREVIEVIDKAIEMIESI